MLLRVRAILKALHAPAGGLDAAARKAEYSRLWALDADGLNAEISKTIDDVEDRTAGLAALHTQAESEIALLARYEPILGKIQPLARQLVVTGAFETVALLVERRYKAGLEELNKELNKLTNNQCEIISADIDENTTAAIVVYSKAYGDAVHKFLAMENVNQIRLPDDFKDMPLDAAYHEIKQRREELPGELARIRKELDDLSAKWYLKLTAAADVLVDKLDELSAIPKFGRTEYAFMIVGWVPTDDCKTVEGRIQERFGSEVIVTRCEISEKDFGDAPVALKNAKVVAPYQSLLGIMGNPSYGTMDPTFLLAIFYPLFFGMIVGDIGYGAIMLATVVWLRMKFKDSDGIQIATGVLGPACTMALAFGFVYAECFGNLFSKYIPLFPLIEPIGNPPVPTLENNPLIPPLYNGAGSILWPFSRISSTTTFLVIAIAVGFIQVALGLIIGMINGARTGHRKHVWEKGGLLAFLVGIIILILASMLSIAGDVGRYALQAVGGIVLFVGIIYAIRGGGIVGALETVGSVAHIMSYARIMAVGLAGAIFADAANGMGEALGSPILGILIAIPLQALNIIIAAFSPNIHAIRLNFLEFFGKFYESGSKPYAPFHKTGGE
jgi:V/A-type H+-transporting ATPase subunit I